MDIPDLIEEVATRLKKIKVIIIDEIDSLLKGSESHEINISLLTTLSQTSFVGIANSTEFSLGKDTIARQAGKVKGIY